MKIKKILLMICILGSFILGVSAQAIGESFATKVDYNFQVNSCAVNFTKPVIDVDGSTYVPLREFATMLGYQVEWDGEQGQIKVENRCAREIEPELDTTFSEELSDKQSHFIYIGVHDERNTPFYQMPELLKRTGIPDIGYVPTPRCAAEIAHAVISKGKDIKMLYNVYFVPELDTWRVLCTTDPPPESGPGMPFSVFINRSNGEIRVTGGY